MDNDVLRGGGQDSPAAASFPAAAAEARELELMSVYTRSTGCDVLLFDYNFRPLEQEGHNGVEQRICRYCTGGCGEGGFNAGGDSAGGQCKNSVPDAGSHGGSRCRRMHVDAIRESARIGGPYIYQCALGLYFWTSALYKDGKFSGALRASGFTGAGAGQEETSASMCCGPIPAEEFRRRVAAFPRAGMEKIKSFAEMLLLCARSLSSGSEDFHKALRSRSVQQASISALLDELKAKNAEGGVLPAYPLEHEKKLIASVRRGDKNEAEKTLNELLAMLVFACSDNFRGIQLRALELAILLVHAGANSGGGAPVENTGCYLKHIQEARTVVELTAVLHKIVGFITAGIVSFQGVPHALAMRRAEIFIRENLTRKIRLNEIARIAGLSAPYFSTIFKEEMGENLSRYINRLRVEKAARMLLETDLSLSAISGACCFEDQSWFSKIFKSVTGLSPGKYRGQGGCLSTNA